MVCYDLGFMTARPPLIASDYSAFALPDFDPNEYANATLAGESYPPQSQAQPGAGNLKQVAKVTGLEPAKEDISVAISKLNFGIDDVSKQIKSVVREFRVLISLQLNLAC